jgi:uncharacterized protein (DUF58 family)
MTNTSTTGLLDSSLLAELKLLELRTRRALSADVVGNYRSAFRGSGLIFNDLREYSPGDDIKSIHWKATARSDKVYVKSYLEDRSIQVVVCVDVSASTSYVPFETRSLNIRERSLHRRAYELAAAIAVLAQQSGDAVGLLLFGDGVESYERPRSGKRAVERLLLTLLTQRTLSSKSDISSAIEHVLKFQKRRSLVFVISDFFCASFESPLAKLSRTHEVVLAQLALDSRAPTAVGAAGEAAAGEQSAVLPSVGLLSVRDPESGQMHMIDTGSKRAMTAFQAKLRTHQSELSRICRELQVDHMIVRDNVLSPLMQLMHRRGSQRGGAASHIIEGASARFSGQRSDQQFEGP